MAKKNTVPARIDAEIFVPEMKHFREINDLEGGVPSMTREIGKLMRDLRIQKREFKIKRIEEIRF